MKACEKKFARVKVQFVPYDFGTLVDVTWHPYPLGVENYNGSGNNGWLEGTVEEGFTRSRLLWCTSDSTWAVGEKRRFDYIPITSLRGSEGEVPCFVSHICG